MSLLKQGISDSKYYLIANIGNKLLAFLVIPILAKTTGVEEFATYDLFLVISAFFNILIILGIDSGIAILLSESKNDDIKLAFLYVSTLLISLSIILIITLILSIIFLFVDELFLLNKEIWLYIGFYVLFNMVSYHTFNFLRFRGKAREASFITLLTYISGMLTGLSLLYLNNSIEAYLQGLVIGLSFGAFIALYIAKDYILKFKVLDNALDLLRELFRLSLPFVPNYLGSNLMQMADRVIILLLFGKYELGLYAIITKIALIPQVIIGTVSGGFLPILLKNYKTQQGKKLIRNFYHLYLILIPITFIIVYFLADWVIMLFVGIQYIEVSYLLPMALMSILFVQSAQANGFGYVIERKTHYIMYITFAAIFLNYIISWILGYWMGLEGILLGTLVVGILKTYFHTFYSEKLYYFNYNFKLIKFISILSFILALLTLGE